MTETAMEKRFMVDRKPMICGSSEAESRSYKMALDGKGCVWFYILEDPNPGGYIYVHDPSDTKSDGFGERTITFRIGKSGHYAAKGPWHSNSDSLFDATGIDLRSKHLTFGCIGLSRASDEQYRTIIEQVQYCDNEPMLGKHERIQEMAKEMANRLGRQVFYYSESSGGSSCGPEYPDGQAPWELRK